MSLFSHDDMHVIHHRDVTPECLTRYSRVVARLIALVLRCHQGWDCEYSMGLTKEQAQACEVLLNSLRAHPRDRSQPQTESERDFDSSEWDELNYSGEPLDDTDNEVHDDVQWLQDDLPFSLGPPVVEEVATNAIQASLLQLLLSLYTHLPAGRDDKFWSPILRFIVLYSVKPSGKWLLARQITQIFAALLFCGRQLMMVLMHRKVTSNPDIRYSAYVDSLPFVLLVNVHTNPVPTQKSPLTSMMTAKGRFPLCTT
jgi:hypothetical protein